MTRPTRHEFVTPGLLALAAAVLLVLGIPAAFGRLTAGVSNNNNTVASNASYTCTAAATVGSNNAYLAYPLSEASGTAAADVSGNSRTGAYQTTGVTYRASGPCRRDTGYAITLDGRAGYVSGPTTTQANPGTFSLEIWFRTASAGGKLIGFGSSRTGSSGNYDRHLYIDSGGRLVFGVYPGAVRTIATTATVTDNKWHQAVGTLTPTAGMALYLDGALVTTDPNTTTAQNFTGYWRIGYDNLSGWTNAPTNSFFTGDLAWAQVYTYALAADQIKAHYLAGA